MKYIDADKLRAEIDAFYTKYKAKFHQNGDSYHLGIIDGLDMAERILDTLEEPEQPTMGYDEAYLNEKIAKASKSWEGVDVDKFIDEIRGREPVTDCHKLKQEIERTYHDGSVADMDDMDHVDYENIARHFAEWQKAKMMEGAVEGAVYRYESYQRIATAIIVDVSKESLGNKVKIIIVKEEE